MFIHEIFKWNKKSLENCTNKKKQKKVNSFILIITFQCALQHTKRISSVDLWNIKYVMCYGKYLENCIYEGNSLFMQTLNGIQSV